MTAEEIFESYNENILKTYTRVPAIFVKGKGSVLTDVHGKKYLDFFPGWGVSNVGHCHPKVMGAVREQIGKLIHIPNNLYHPFQAKLARELIRISFLGKIFFCKNPRAFKQKKHCDEKYKAWAVAPSSPPFKISAYPNHTQSGRNKKIIAGTKWNYILE